MGLVGFVSSRFCWEIISNLTGTVKLSTMTFVRPCRLREGGDIQDASCMVANPDRVKAAMRSFSAMAPSVADGKEPQLAQACMRPCAPDVSTHCLPLLIS